MTVENFLSAKDFAEKLGTTRKTVNKLAREGHLTRMRDNSFPWPQAKYEWEKYQQGRQKQRPVLSQQKLMKSIIENDETDFDNFPTDDNQDQISPISNSDQRKKDLNNLSISAQIIDALQKNIDGSENSAYYWARALNEATKARTSMLAMLDAESKTLKRDDVETWVYNVSRQNRDIWLNWPQRVSTEMAEELGVDARLMNDILLKAVRKNLERVASLPEHYGTNSGSGISEGAETTNQD